VAGHETSGGHSVERGEAWIEYRVGERDEVLRRFRVDTRTDWTAEEVSVVFVDELPRPEPEPETETDSEPEPDPDPDPGHDHDHDHDHGHDHEHVHERQDEPTRPMRPARLARGTSAPESIGTVDGDPLRPVLAWHLMPDAAADLGSELLYTTHDPARGLVADVDPVALRTMARDADLVDRHVNMPVGRPLDRADASRAVAMLAGGDREGYRVLGLEGDPRLEPHTVEWGVALLDDGRAAVVRGGKYGVSLAGRTLVESSRALDDDNLLLEPGTIDDLLRGPDGAMLAPSPDTGATGLERIRDRELLPFVIHLPFAHLGDGRIGNPQTGAATRLAFVLTDLPERRTYGGQDVWTITGEYRVGADTIWRGTYHLARPRYADDLFLTFDLDDMERRFGLPD
jgi:hypothetical protein